MNKLFWIYDDCLQSQLRLKPASLLAGVGQYGKAPAVPRKVKRSKKSMAIFLKQDLTVQDGGEKHSLLQTPDLSFPKFQHLLLSFLKLRCSAWDTYTAASIKEGE